MGRHAGNGLRLRGGIWQVDVTVAGCRVVRSTLTANREEAERFRDQLRAELWRVGVAHEAPRVTFLQGATAYLEDREGRLRDIETVRDRLRWICKQIGNLAITDIDAPRIRQLLALRRKQGVVRMIQLRDGSKKRVQVADTVADATLDRYGAAISAVLHHCQKQGWLKATVPKVERLSPMRKGVPKFLTAEQAAELIAHLPEHHVPMIRFALATGLRRSNVTGLTWDRVDLARRKAWILAADAKGKRDIPVPLNEDAHAVLCGQLGKHPTLVFPYKGRRVTRVTGTAWRKALEAAGLPITTRFHDLRHTWASWHAMNGTPTKILQQLGGWRDASMVEVYATLAQEVVSDYAGNARPVSLVTNRQHLHLGLEPETPEGTDSTGVADGTRTHDDRNHKAVG